MLKACRPGNYLRPGEPDEEGLKKRLDEQLADDDDVGNWEIGDCLSMWYRPAFEAMMVSL